MPTINRTCSHILSHLDAGDEGRAAMVAHNHLHDRKHPAGDFAMHPECVDFEALQHVAQRTLFIGELYRCHLDEIASAIFVDYEPDDWARVDTVKRV